jgi:hypothetical protein
MLTLKFDKSEIRQLAARYPEKDEATIQEVAARLRTNGYLTKADFLALCHWKSPRTQPRAAENSEEFIRAVTEAALTTSSEQLRIEVLTLLRGVSWPTASVILHFGHHQGYPILDVRALWSLNAAPPPAGYDFEFWWAYVQACRQLADECGVDMRTLDRALWQYSKEQQPVLNA